MAFGHFKRFLGSESVIGTDRAAFRKASEQLQSVVSRSADTLANSAESIIGTSRPALEAASSQLSATATRSADLLSNSAESVIGTSRQALSEASSVLAQQVEQSADLLDVQNIPGDLAVTITGSPLFEDVKSFQEEAVHRLDEIVVTASPLFPKVSPPATTLAGSVQWGLTRPNRFEVLIHPPKILREKLAKTGSYMQYADEDTKGQILLGVGNRLRFTCEAASLPGRSLGTKENQQYGPMRKHPYSQIYTDLALTFMVGRDMLEKKIFETWQQSIFDPITHNWNYYEDYTTNVEIFQLTEHDDRIYGIKLIEAYPVTIGDMPLSYADTDTYQRLPVTLAYRRWVELKAPDKTQDFRETVPTTKSLHGTLGVFSDDVPPEARAAVDSGQFTYDKNYGLQKI